MNLLKDKINSFKKIITSSSGNDYIDNDVDDSNNAGGSTESDSIDSTSTTPNIVNTSPSSTPKMGASNTTNTTTSAPTTSNTTTQPKRNNGLNRRKKSIESMEKCRFVSVQVSDSLLSIARKYNMTEEDLMVLNRLDTRNVYYGQILMVCLNFTCKYKYQTKEQQLQQEVDLGMGYDIVKSLKSEIELVTGEDNIGTKALDVILSHKQFLPNLREKYDYFISKVENELVVVDHTNLASSQQNTPITEVLMSFKNVIYFNESLTFRGNIYINTTHLVFAPQSSNYSFNRIDIEIQDIIAWKFDSHIDSRLTSEHHINENECILLKLWTKFSHGQDSIISSFNSNDTTLNQDPSLTYGFNEKIFIIDRKENDIESCESVLINIIGKPVNLKDDFLTSGLGGKFVYTTKTPTNTPVSPLGKTLFIPISTLSTSPPPSTSNEVTPSIHPQPIPPSSVLLSSTNRVNEKDLIKQEISCIFDLGRVKGTLTLMPHWLIFQADPNDPLVKKEGSVKFQLNYTMNQVISCGMVPKTFLSTSMEDLQFGMDDTGTTQSTNTSTTTNNSSSKESFQSAVNNILNGNNVNISSVHVVIQVLPTIEKDILIECEDESAHFICQQIRLWMNDIKSPQSQPQQQTNSNPINTSEGSSTSPTTTLILDNIMTTNSGKQSNSINSSGNTSFTQSILNLTTTKLDKYLESKYLSSTYDLEGEIPQSDVKLGNFAPQLLKGPSVILNDQDVQQLIVDLPIFYKLRDWTLLYSTATHGISINTMYSKCKEKGACILVIRDSYSNVFGGFLSESLKISKQYYGSGECFIFKMKPSYYSYHWSKENECFIQTTEKFISMGGGNNGKYGLWLDEDLDQGCTNKCETYDNEKLTQPDEFRCIDLEIWGFV